MQIEDDGKLVTSGTTLAVGIPFADDADGIVHLYNNIRGRWIKQQTIRQPDVVDFGYSVTVYGSHMAVSGLGGDSHSVIFTYQLDASSNTWINNGRFALENIDFLHLSSVSMHQNHLVVTVTDKDRHPGVCGYVYKLSQTPTYNKNGGEVFKWNHVGVLTTKTDPLTEDYQVHWAVGVDEQMAYIGRYDSADNGVGKLFLHDLSNI